MPLTPILENASHETSITSYNANLIFQIQKSRQMTLQKEVITLNILRINCVRKAGKNFSESGFSE
jgi:hypothetical protein